MYASVRALLSGIIDYAGLFPPAQLPLAEALRLYLQAKKNSPYAWMLGRFVCPVGRLAELGTLINADGKASLLSLTIVGNQASNPKGNAFLASLESDLHAINAFRQRHEHKASIASIEVQLHPAIAVDELVHDLGYAATHLEQSKLKGFLEIPQTSHWQEDLSKLAHGVEALFDAWDEGLLGLKLRCGGTTAQAFAGDKRVAFFIAQTKRAQVSWKATAGLHHARRHWDATMDLWHQGFLNVFIAAAIAWTTSVEEAIIADVLADRDGDHFRFENDVIWWQHWSCTTEQIAEARANFATSFGSCSFEEPVRDLLAMGLLS